MTLFRKKYRIESIRCRRWDYTGHGLYFITICTRHRKHYFGVVRDEIMHLSTIGRIAEQQWKEIPGHFDNVILDEFVVMPDHFQAVIAIHGPKNEPRLITPGCPLREPLRSPESRSLGNVVRQYKAGVARWCQKAGIPFAWQAGFHDRIIYASSLAGVRQYIRDNPKNWGKPRR
jgi:REP element-mobilizing transposase RayT